MDFNIDFEFIESKCPAYHRGSIQEHTQYLMGQNLASIQSLKKESNSVIENLLGITAPTLRSWKTGKSSIPMHSAAKLATHWRFPLPFLMRHTVYGAAFQVPSTEEITVADSLFIKIGGESDETYRELIQLLLLMLGLPPTPFEDFGLIDHFEHETIAQLAPGKYYKTIGGNFRRIRKEVGASQDQFSQLLGVTPKTYAAYEKGQGKVTALSVARFCVAAGRNPLEIIKGSIHEEQRLAVADRLMYLRELCFQVGIDQFRPAATKLLLSHENQRLEEMPVILFKI